MERHDYESDEEIEEVEEEEEEEEDLDGGYVPFTVTVADDGVHGEQQFDTSLMFVRGRPCVGVRGMNFLILARWDSEERVDWGLLNRTARQNAEHYDDVAYLVAHANAAAAVHDVDRTAQRRDSTMWTRGVVPASDFDCAVDGEDAFGHPGAPNNQFLPFDVKYTRRGRDRAVADVVGTRNVVRLRDRGTVLASWPLNVPAQWDLVNAMARANLKLLGRPIRLRRHVDLEAAAPVAAAAAAFPANEDDDMDE